MTTETYLSEELIDKVEAALADAIRKVEREEVTKASVGLSFDVALDDDMKPQVCFTHKHTTTQKGSFRPVSNPRLPFAER